MANRRIIRAVYENGVLRPLTPLSGLADGQEVFVRVREIVTDPAEVKRRAEKLHRSMEARGLIEKVPPPAEPPPADWKPLVIEGEPLSETVIRMRGEG